jgi:hypothetical protein
LKHSKEKPIEGRFVDAFVEEVVEHFADRDHGTARRERRVEHRSSNEFARRNSTPGQLDHRLRLIHAKDVEACPAQRFGRDAAPAPEVDDPAAVDPDLVQTTHQGCAPLLRPVAEGQIVDEGNIGSITLTVFHFTHILESQRKREPAST